MEADPESRRGGPDLARFLSWFCWTTVSFLRLIHQKHYDKTTRDSFL